MGDGTHGTDEHKNKNEHEHKEEHAVKQDEHGHEEPAHDEHGHDDHAAEHGDHDNDHGGHDAHHSKLHAHGFAGVGSGGNHEGTYEIAEVAASYQVNDKLSITGMAEGVVHNHSPEHNDHQPSGSHPDPADDHGHDDHAAEHGDHNNDHGGSHNHYIAQLGASYNLVDNDTFKTNVYGGVQMGFGQHTSTTLFAGLSETHKPSGISYSGGLGYNTDTKDISTQFNVHAAKLPLNMEFNAKGEYNISDNALHATVMLSKEIGNTGLSVMAFDKYDSSLGNTVGAGVAFKLGGH